MSTKAICLAILLVSAISTSTLAQSPSASVGGSCTKIGSLSGTIATPLVCQKVGTRLKWVLAPGGNCSKGGALAGTVTKPWVCQKVSGKLKWVVINTSTATTISSTTTTSVKPINVPTSTVAPIVTVAPTTTQIRATTTTIACPTGSYTNNVGSLSQPSTFPASEPGYTYYPYMRYVGSFTNNTTSSLIVSGVARISFAPPFTYGVLSPQDISLLVNSGSDVPAGATVLVSGFFSGPSSVVPSVASVSVSTMWNTAPLVAFCPAPVGR